MVWVLFKSHKNQIHYWIKTCENAVKNLWIKLWKNMWTVQFHMFSHMFFTPFSQGVKLLRPCEKGSFHRVRTHAKPCEKPCEFLPCEKTCERPCEKTCERPCEKPVKNLWTFTLFFTYTWKYWATAGTLHMVFHPYPRRLESLSICRCHYIKGSSFFSVI